MCLQETKSKVITEAKYFSVWGNNIVGWLHNEGVNGCGSLLSMWNEDAFSYNSHMMGKGFIVVFRNYLKSNLRCVMVNVYAACIINNKKILWEELSNTKLASQDKVWCFCGYFNAVRSRSERKGISDGGGPSSPHHGSQDPRLDPLEPCEERLDSRGERLAHDKERLQEERLGGSLDRLGPITRCMTKHLHAQMGLATVPSRIRALTKSRSKSTPEVKVNTRRRLGEETPSTSVAKRKRRRGKASPR